jgi:membrane-bound inhibitor of C-type lysozyme
MIGVRIWRPGVVLVGLLLAGPALAAPEFQSATYQCSRGGSVPVTYVQDTEGGLAVLMLEGRQIVLLAEPAASGARYGWPSDGASYVWWTKGDEASLYWKEGATETPLETCSARQ